MAAGIDAQEARTTVIYGLDAFEKAATQKNILLQLQQYQYDSRNTQDGHQQTLSYSRDMQIGSPVRQCAETQKSAYTFTKARAAIYAQKRDYRR